MTPEKREKAPKQILPERQAVLMPEGVEIRLLGHWRTFAGLEQRHAAYPIEIKADGLRWVLEPGTDSAGRWVYRRDE